MTNSSRKRPPSASPAFAPRASAFAKATGDKTAGRLLRIHVERFNPALRLSERLGFRQIDDRGVYLFMEWRGDNSQTPTPNGSRSAHLAERRGNKLVDTTSTLLFSPWELEVES